MSETQTAWNDKLAEWLKTNPKTMPKELQDLRDQFVQRFPPDKLASLTLDEYALGRPTSDDSFSQWLEYKTKELGTGGGGYAIKHGVYWSKKAGAWAYPKSSFSSPEAALSQVTQGLTELVHAVQSKQFSALDEIAQKELGSTLSLLRIKALYLYFPDAFLPIGNPEHLRYFLTVFGQPTTGGAFTLNRRLLQTLKAQPDFAGMDTRQMMKFLYDRLPPPGWRTPQVDPLDGTAPEELNALMSVTERTRNVILYGPPGTGKTWLTNRFVDYFLLHHNFPNSGKASKYWQAVSEGDVVTAAQLQGEVRADPEVEVEPLDYWWVTANPKDWKWDELFKKGGEFFERGRLEKNFALIGVGDIVFGYEAHPTKKLVAIARIKDDHAMQKIEGPSIEGRPVKEQQVEGFILEPVAKLKVPLSWQDLAADPVLGHSEPILNNARGTLFRLSAEEASHLADLLQAKGDHLAVPIQSRHRYVELVTFHQSFAYEEFVEGLRAITEEGQIRYAVVDGILRRICRKAQADPEHRYVLVIDEINRANIAKVFGELITLVEDDKRLGQENALSVTLPYSQEPFGIPKNLYLLGTMNTADRSIALLDLALRRRFAFVKMPPDPTSLKDQSVNGADVHLDKLLAELNARIAALLDDDHQIGHAYFLGVDDLPSLQFVWYDRIVPLLQEYFYGDGERLKTVLGDKLIQRVDVSKVTQKALGDLYDSERPRYRVVELDDPSFVNALREIAEAGTPTGSSEASA